LQKAEPNKIILRKEIEWAAKFGEKVFWQLLPLLLQHYEKLGI